jgi:hypothetical protein
MASWRMEAHFSPGIRGNSGAGAEQGRPPVNSFKLRRNLWHWAQSIACD